MRIQWHQLKAWPPRRTPTLPSERIGDGGRFRTTVAASIDALEYELTKIEATGVVIEIDVAEQAMTRSGEPYATAQFRTTPGVVLHFTDRTGQAITMPCDKYRAWQFNLHALVLTLRALRAVDRHGATAGGEQYRGWTAIPAVTTPTLSTRQAAELLATWSGDGIGVDAVLASQSSAKQAYRLAMKRSHPDRTESGGSNQKFTLVQEAGRILAAQHGVEKL